MKAQNYLMNFEVFKHSFIKKIHQYYIKGRHNTIITLYFSKNYPQHFAEEEQFLLLNALFYLNFQPK